MLYGVTELREGKPGKQKGKIRRHSFLATEYQRKKGSGLFSRFFVFGVCVLLLLNVKAGVLLGNL